MKSKPQRTLRYRRGHKVKTLRSRPNGKAGRALRSLCVLCGYLFFFSQAAYSQSDKFGGIGVSVDIDSSVMRPYIVDILSGKPGAMAGLRSGDHILSISHWKTKGKSQEQVANKLRGRIGSQVDLDIDRGGKEMDFVMKREQIVVNEKAGNLCEGLDTVLKSLVDSFDFIKGEKVADLSGNYEIWKSKLKIRVFDNARIYENANIPSFLGLDYFIGRDKIEVENEYKKLIADIEDCLPYTVCKDFKEEKDTTDEGIMTATFRITSVKDNYYASLKRSELHIRYYFDGINYYVMLSFSRTENDGCR